MLPLFDPCMLTITNEATSSASPSSTALEFSRSLDDATPGKRVIFWPALTVSHVMNIVLAARELTALGHQVWVIIPASIAAKGGQDFGHHQGFCQSCRVLKS
jgi:hypothetical protein